MITNEIQCRATRSHLVTFEAAVLNLEMELAGRDDRLTRLKLDAVRAQAEGLRAEVAEYEGAEACD